MTVVPLVVSLLITGVGSCSNMRVVRGIGLHALAFFLGLLVFAGVAGLLMVPPLLRWLHLYAATVATLRPNGGTTAAPNVPSFEEWAVSVGALFRA